jgi:hypothetical protein
MLLLGQTLNMVDPDGRVVGRITLEEQEGDLLCGRFQPEVAFATAAPLFQAFEKAVNAQALSVVDELDRGIDALGFAVTLAGSAQALPIKDLQIWSDGGVSCRLVDSKQNSLNGAASGRKSSQRP